MNDRIKKTLKRLIPESILRKAQERRRRPSIDRAGKLKIRSFEPGRYPAGINHIGPASQSSGLGQAFRLVADEIRAAGIPYQAYEYCPAAGRTRFDDQERDTFCPYAVNLIEVNMHEFADAVLAMGTWALDGRYNIAFWSWEVPEFPQEWIPLINVLDEIWTPSEFTSEAIRRVTDKPVITVPYHVEVRPDESLDRCAFGLPEDRFLYLMMFDKGSVAERKNPQGVIDAFRKAFEAGGNREGSDDKRRIPALAVRILAADEYDKKKIRKQLEDYEVYFIDGDLSKDRVDRLVQLCDVYVSLHRAEGFGLVLAEAMLLGTPVVATGYSANLEFQTEEDTCLVGYETVKVGKTVGLFRATDTWAQPDTDSAARYMRRLYEDREYYYKIAEGAQEAARRKLAMEVPVGIITSRLEGTQITQRVDL